MNTIPAQELKRRGIGAVDEMVKQGEVVHVIKNNRSKYVVLSEERYRALMKAEENATVERIKESLEDVDAGRVKRYKNAKSLIKKFGLEK